MSIKQSIRKIAKEIKATKVTQKQAYNYLDKAGYNDLQMELKDIKRIQDMNKKTNGGKDVLKYRSLVSQMSKAITKPEKAFRRGDALLTYSDLGSRDAEEIASIFFEKAVELG